MGLLPNCGSVVASDFGAVVLVVALVFEGLLHAPNAISNPAVVEKMNLFFINK
jgi:hypothetical protein